MKSTIKRWLFAGIALSLAALTSRRFQRELEIEGSLDGPQSGKPSLPPGRDGKGKASPLPTVSGGSGRTGPLPGTPAAGPVLYSPTVSVTFNGTLVRKGSQLALREIAGSLYRLDGATNASGFEGTNVRVTGKIDLSTRLLHVDAIEPAVL